MNYEKEYIRLWNAAEQALKNIDFEIHLVGSWAALRVLKNAVDWGRDKPSPIKPVTPDRRNGSNKHGGN